MTDDRFVVGYRIGSLCALIDQNRPYGNVLAIGGTAGWVHEGSLRAVAQRLNQSTLAVSAAEASGGEQGLYKLAYDWYLEERHEL